MIAHVSINSIAECDLERALMMGCADPPIVRGCAGPVFFKLPKYRWSYLNFYLINLFHVYIMCVHCHHLD